MKLSEIIKVTDLQRGNKILLNTRHMRYAVGNYKKIEEKCTVIHVEGGAILYVTETISEMEDRIRKRG